MKRNALIPVVLLVCGAVEAAAQQVRQPLTIEDALRLAADASETVELARAGVQRGRGEQVRARAALLPQLNASLGYDRALASEFKGLFSGSDSTSSGGPPSDSSSSSGGFNFSKLPFGRENTWRAGLTLSQTLFAGGRVLAQNRIAATTRRLADIGLESARAQTALEAAQAYYDAALSERLLSIAEATLAQAETTLRQVELGRQVGNQPEFELLRAQVQRDNQVPAVIQRRSERDVALLRLKQLLDIPAAVEVELTTPLVDSLPALEPRADSAGLLSEAAVLERAPVRQALEALRAQQASFTIARAQRFPAVNLVSSYTRVNYPPEFAPELDAFRTNWTLGVSLQVPLFAGGRLHGDALVANAGVLEARARVQQAKELAELDNRAALQQLAAAEAAWRASAGTVEQAEKAYRIAQLRFREGLSGQLELSDSRILLQQAQATRVRAARDVQVARLRVSLLRDLPLMSSGSTQSGRGQNL